MYNISYWFLIFFIFSILGYFTEVIYCFIKDKKLINRGFMYGPYCPIYGVGAFCTILLLKKYQTDPIVIFVFGTIICSIIEYLASYLLEKIFKNKWWDYSKYKYNINGRICLKNSILFGLCCLCAQFLFYPIINKILLSINKNLLPYLLIIFIIFFITDLIFSIINAEKLKKQLNIIIEIKNKFKINIPKILEKKVMDALSKYKTYPKHLIEAFPNIKLFHKDNINLIKKSIDKKKNNIDK